MVEIPHKPIPHPADYAEDATLPRLNFGLRPLLLLVLLGGLIVVFLFSLAVGSVSIPFDQIITVLLGGEAERNSWANIVRLFGISRGKREM